MKFYLTQNIYLFYFLSYLLFLLIPQTFLAKEAQKPQQYSQEKNNNQSKTSLRMDFNIASAYLFRGDTHLRYTRDQQDKEKGKTINNEPLLNKLSLQPSFIIEGIEYLMFETRLQYALEDREQHKLSQFDEIDIILAYKDQNHLGNLTFGFNFYNYLKKNESISTNAEIFFSYSLPKPVVKDILFYISSNIGTNPFVHDRGVYDYVALSYSKHILLSKPSSTSNKQAIFLDIRTELAFKFFKKRHILKNGDLLQDTSTSFTQIYNISYLGLQFGTVHQFSIGVSYLYRIKGYVFKDEEVNTLDIDRLKYGKVKQEHYFISIGYSTVLRNQI